MSEEFVVALTRVLVDRGVIAAGVEVEGLRRLSGGASRETWAFGVTGEEAEGHPVHGMILQRERPGAARTGPGMSSEALLLRAAASAGVPVPEVLATDEGGDDLGAPFVITRAVPGETIPRKLLRDPELDAVRGRLAHECGRVLAEIHSVPVASVRDVLDEPDQIVQFRDLLDLLGEPHPAFELAFRWLDRRRPDPVATSLVHGDFRNGNLIIGPDGVRAVLDWELAHLGDPVEDLGWFCVRAWRFGSPHRAGGFGPAEDLLDGYREGGGADVDMETLRWWEVMGTLKWGVMCVIQAMTHLGGTSRSVELAAIGRRTCENEWDLLELIS